jgi:tetratricopeptide (TPR) repeat protein
MAEEIETYTEAEAHRHFAIQFNGQAWDLLDKAERTPEEDERMLHSAFASCRHWLQAGTGLHHQRGEWLLARVYSVLGLGDAALRHARRCLELTEQHADLMADFDRAFALEAMARANAIAGNRDRALEYIERAKEAGEAIAQDDDKSIFWADFDGGEWAGLK